MKMTPAARILLLSAGLLAAYQVSVGIDGLGTVPVTAYTVAFGTLLVTGLLLLILGFEVLDSPVIAVLATLIPLALSLGLVWQHRPGLRLFYLSFAGIGLAAITVTRFFQANRRVSAAVLALIHGVAGMIIFLLPILLAIQGTARPLFSLVGVGGALIGLGGLLLAFIKQGSPILSQAQIYRVLPGLLFLTTLCFTAGFLMR